MKKFLFIVSGLFFIGTSVLADQISDGKAYFTQTTCNTCHSLTSKKEPSHTGPALYGTTKRYSKEWLVSWISDPEEMLKKDAIAKKLLVESGNIPMTPMLKLMNKKPDGSVDTALVKTKAEAIYAFLKDNDSKPDGGDLTAIKKKKN